MDWTIIIMTLIIATAIVLAIGFVCSTVNEFFKRKADSQPRSLAEFIGGKQGGSDE